MSKWTQRLSSIGVTIGLTAASPVVFLLLYSGCRLNLLTTGLCSNVEWATVFAGLAGYSVLSGLVADTVRWTGRRFEGQSTFKPVTYRRLLRGDF